MAQLTAVVRPAAPPRLPTLQYHTPAAYIMLSPPNTAAATVGSPRCQINTRLRTLVRQLAKPATTVAAETKDLVAAAREQALASLQRWGAAWVSQVAISVLRLCTVYRASSGAPRTCVDEAPMTNDKGTG
eukprot:COSAG01_NODE_4319_length_5136_cov_2.603216_4_plen_130_part_00